MKPMKRKLRQKLVGSVVLASAKQVLDYMPQDKLDAVKKVDSRPKFAVFNLGAEGVSNAKLSIYSDPDLPWYKQMWSEGAIKQLVTCVRAKLERIYIGHKENSDDQRVSIGELIFADTREEDGKTTAVGIGYIASNSARKQFEEGELDICSIEAECLFEQDENDETWYVSEVLDFKGLAVGNSEDMTPGFEGASVRGVLAALHKKGKTEAEREAKMQTLSEVKDFIRQQGWRPEQVFESKDLLDSPVVSGAIKTELDEKTKELKEKVTHLETEIAPLRSLEANSKLSDMIGQSNLLNDAPKEMVAYLKKTVNIDLSSIPEAERKEKVDEAVKKQIEIIEETGIQFDKKKEGSTTPDPEKKKTTGRNEQANTEKAEEDKDYETVEDNELIPTS